jgi:hypothetical protein
MRYKVMIKAEKIFEAESPLDAIEQCVANLSDENTTVWEESTPNFWSIV